MNIVAPLKLPETGVSKVRHPEWICDAWNSGCLQSLLGVLDVFKVCPRFCGAACVHAHPPNQPPTKSGSMPSGNLPWHNPRIVPLYPHVVSLLQQRHNESARSDMDMPRSFEGA